MQQRKKKKGSKKKHIIRFAYVSNILLISGLVLFFTFQSSSVTHVTAATGDIQVDFTKIVHPIDPLTFGMDISGYGNGKDITNDPTEQQAIKKLNLGQMRMDLNANLQCGGSGCATSVSGDSWINGIKAAGAEPVLIVPSNPTDAANVVKHFNTTTNNHINRFIIGNEPDNGGVSAATYSNSFNQAYDAIKKVDPTALIGGPATASFNTAFLQTFFANSGSRVDFLDYHAYGEGGTVSKTEAELLASTVNYETNIKQLKTMATGTKAGQNIPVEVGEWNTSWSGDSTKQRANFNTVWAASVMGHMINAGGLGLQYADKNGSLGALDDSGSVDTPLPIYHGIGMFTGESVFPHFGSNLATSTTTLANIEVYASTNPNIIIVINKDPSVSQAATIGLTGYTSGTADAWQENQTSTQGNPPQKVASATITNGSFSYTFPPYSVTTLVLSGSQAVSVTPNMSITPSGSTGSTSIAVSLCPHGIGNCGDNAAPNTSGNSNPSHTSRNAIVSLFDATGQQAATAQGQVQYDTTKKVFTGTLQLTTVSPGLYTVKVIMDEFLSAQIPGAFTISTGTTTLPTTTVVAGDINKDNQLDIQDYNMLISCYGTKQTTAGCLAEPTTQSLGADINDDGSVNGVDYNLFLRELSTQK